MGWMYVNRHSVAHNFCSRTDVIDLVLFPSHAIRENHRDQPCHSGGIIVNKGGTFVDHTSIERWDQRLRCGSATGGVLWLRQALTRVICGPRSEEHTSELQ